MSTATQTSEALTVIPAWVLAGVGPRRVGGWYQSAWGGPYTVLEIDANPGGFRITERFDGEWGSRSHSVPWDDTRDEVIRQPDDAAVQT